MPPPTSRPRRVAREPRGACAPRASACPTSPTCSQRRPHTGSACACRAGTDKAIASSSSLGNRGTAPCRTAANPLLSAARSCGPARSAGSLLHRSGARTVADPPLVCPALAGRSHLPRGARDHLGVETQRQWSDRALHAVSARAVLAGRPARRSSPPQARRASRPPPRIASDSRRRPPPVLAAEGFFTSYLTAVAQKSRPALHEAIAYALCHAA